MTHLFRMDLNSRITYKDILTQIRTDAHTHTHTHVCYMRLTCKTPATHEPHTLRYDAHKHKHILHSIKMGLEHIKGYKSKCCKTASLAHLDHNYAPLSTCIGTTFTNIHYTPSLAHLNHKDARVVGHVITHKPF